VAVEEGSGEAIPAGVTGRHHLEAPLALHWGGRLVACDVGYELVGDPRLPLLVVLGGISAHRHVTAHAADDTPGWWQEFVGPGRALDTERFAVLGVDWLGGRGASTLPPGDLALDTRDQARLVTAVLDRVRVARAHAVVGASYGGMVALALAAIAPERLGRAVVIGAAHESAPMSTALRSIQRQIVQLGLETGRVAQGLTIARALGMTTDRSAVEFDERFAAPPVVENGRARFVIESYLEYQGRKFSESFPPEGFLALSQSLDLHRVDPADVRAPVTLIGVEEDTLVPPGQLRALAAALGARADLVMLRSRYGHDAFLKDPAVAAAAARAIAAGG
jgi:homoserine O-acetyltransferase